MFRQLVTVCSKDRIFAELVILFLLVLFSVVSSKDLKKRCSSLLKSTEVEQLIIPPGNLIDKHLPFQIYHCLWVIKGAEDKMIRLHFRDLYVDYFPFCKLAKIQIDDDDRLVGVYCGYGDRDPVFTKTQHFYIMSTFDSHIFFYFNASYSLVAVPKKQCGGLLRDMTGWFSSPDHDNSGWYDANSLCIWVLEAATNNVMILRFLYMDIRGMDDCKGGDYIEMQYEYDQRERFCGAFQSPVVASQSNVLKVRFYTDYQDHGQGFNATFFQVQASSFECGGFMSQSEGQITYWREHDDINIASSPGMVYEEKFECFWIVNGDEEKIIEFRILEMDIEKSKDCQNASLYIHDGTATLGTFCGSAPPGNSTVTSASNHLFIWLSADENFHLVRLSATYTQMYDFSPECGELVTRITGRISSPDSQDPVDCLWVLQAEQHMRIHLDIRVLDTAWDDPCKDYLMVFERESSRRDKVCGSINPKNPYRSRSNTVYIRFHSRRSRASNLDAKYTQLPALDKSCGGTLNATAWGYVTHVDNDHDRNYDHNLNCLWLIKAEEKKHILLKFDFFEMESSEKCKNDFLKISEDGDSGERVCADMPVTALHKMSTSNKMYVQFVSDESLNNHGFYATFEELEEFETVCRREINTTSGWLVPESSDLFMLIGEMQDCSYLLWAESGKVIELEFSEVTISWTAICYNFLQVKNWLEDRETDKFYEMSKTCHLVGGRERGSGATTAAALESDKPKEPEAQTDEQPDTTRQWEGELKNKTGLIDFPNTHFLGVPHYNLKVVWQVKAGYHEVVLLEVVTWTLNETVTFIGNDNIEITEPHREIRGYTSFSASDKRFSRLSTEYDTLLVTLTTDGWAALTDATSYLLGLEFSPYSVELNATYTIIEETDACADEYSCLMSNKTISKDLLCDEVDNCPFGDDERFCYLICPLNCTCLGLVINCTGNSTCNNKYRNDRKIYRRNYYDLQRYPHSEKVLDVSNSPQVYQSLQENITKMVYLEVLNISRCEITEIQDRFFGQMTSLIYLDLSYNALKRLTSNMFKNQGNLKTLLLEGNSEIIDFESAAFSGLTALETLVLSNLHIGNIAEYAFSLVNKQTDFEILHSIIDMAEDKAFGDLHTDNMVLKTTNILGYSNRMFEKLSNVTKLVTNAYKFCCIRPYYLAEKDCFPHKGMFSTCDDLLGNSRSRYFFWVTGLLTLFSNILAVKHHFSSDEPGLRYRHHFFLMNLALSDGLMGVFIVTIVGTDASLRGNYAFQEDTWLSSSGCLISSALSSTSIIATSLILCLIAMSRFCVIQFSSGEVRFSRKLAFWLTSVVWSVALLMSILPIFYSTFIANDVHSKLGICIGFPLRHNKPPGWYFSVTVLVLVKCLTVLLIVLSFWAVRKELKKTDAKLIRPRLNRTDDLKVSRNILTLVGIHALCMTPIYVLGVFGWGVVVMDDETYGWMVIVILAVMAAVNPLLFNLADLFDITELAPSEDEQSRPVICTEEEFDQIVSLLKDERFWWLRTRKRGYVSLAKLVRAQSISYEECALIAIGMLRRIYGLHARGLAQIELRARDIFIKRRRGKRTIHVALVCRPQMIKKPTETAVNMANFGYLLSRVIEQAYKKQNAEPGDD